MQNEWQRFIDTNIFVYAEDQDDPVKHDLAMSIISELTNNAGGVITTQVLAEFSNIMRKAMSASDINSRIFDYQNSFRVITYSVDEIKKANELSETYKVHFFDALIAATMNSQNINIIITENEDDFKKIPWLNVENPFKKK